MAGIDLVRSGGVHATGSGELTANSPASSKIAIMGLMIHSLGELPASAARGFFVYLLDYGWDDPLWKVVIENFNKMAELASSNDAVVIRGTVAAHFTDEVLSWHQINGESGETVLPALMVTTRNPHQFKQGNRESDRPPQKDSILLIPLRRMCKSPVEVVPLIEQLFSDIKEKQQLSSFQVAKELRAGIGKAIVDSLILEPNLGGVGVNLMSILNFLRGRRGK
ncbi:MAG: hypothetical protein HONBIEJF_02954 [Fimbriimonadaceae bacterium]|nr:hypothetical protein [Fimbriimonadaceae bacterium]